MTERTLPSDTCPHCGGYIGIIHECSRQVGCTVCPDCLRAYGPGTIHVCPPNPTMEELRTKGLEQDVELKPDGCKRCRSLEARLTIRSRIIDQQAEQLSYQAKEIKAKNKVFKYLRDNVARDNVLSIQDIERMCKQTLKDGA